MKESGMIFNEYQVRALLDGSMTQVRKIMKVQPDEDGLAKVTDGPWVDTSERIYRCPFGAVGDRLYVREPFSRLDSFNFFDPEVPRFLVLGRWRTSMGRLDTPTIRRINAMRRKPHHVGSYWRAR